MRYYRVSDGERMKTEGKPVRMRCCDCGLIHLMRFTVVDGEVEIEAWRDERATRASRKRTPGNSNSPSP